MVWILLSDIRSFTNISATMSPEQIAVELGPYLPINQSTSSTARSWANKRWFERDNGKRLARDRELVAEHYPQLVYHVDEQCVRLRGPMLWGSQLGILTSRVGVRIEFLDGYPRVGTNRLR